jgi:hypothetical protein
MAHESAFGVWEGDDAPQRMARLFGPTQVDQTIRQAIQLCWMSLPESRRTPDEVERQVRRVFERAIQNLREDFSAFGSDRNSGT